MPPHSSVWSTATPILFALWSDKPEVGLQQVVLTIVVWLHAVIGLRNWLSMKRGYARWSGWLFAGTILISVLGLLGFVQGGMRGADPAWVMAMVEQSHILPVADEVAAFSDSAQPATAVFITGTILLLITGRGLRTMRRRKQRPVRIRYPGDRFVDVERGTTVLEASRRAGIPQASVCGGRGYCSTCRIRISDRLDAQSPPSSEEATVLKRIHAADDIRLACQIAAQVNLTVTPLIAPASSRERILAAQ